MDSTWLGAAHHAVGSGSGSGNGKYRVKLEARRWKPSVCHGFPLSQTEPAARSRGRSQLRWRPWGLHGRQRTEAERLLSPSPCHAGRPAAPRSRGTCIELAISDARQGTWGRDAM